MDLKNKVIPSHLKDKFIEELGTDISKLNEKVIDDFLEKQGINRYTGKLADILKKNKDVEDRISKIEKHDSKVKQMIKESKYGK